MSAPSINTTLPESSSPTIDHFRGVGREILPFALYMHVELYPPDLTELLLICNSKHGEDSVRLAPSYKMHGQPLRKAYDVHMDEVAFAGVFDPIYFVAVVNREWRSKGVVLVTLDTERDEVVCAVDQMRVCAENAGLYLVNLQIGNVEWGDYKEEEGDFWGSGDDHDSSSEEGKFSSNDDGTGDQDDVGKTSSDKREEPEVVDAEIQETNPTALATDTYVQMTDEEYSDGASPTAPSIDYWIGLYAIHGLDFEVLMRELDNSPVRRPSSEIEVRPQGRIPSDYKEAIAEASRLHPMRCRNNPLLCRDMFLIADTHEYHERGLLLVRIEWDQQIEGQSMGQLAIKGSQARTDTRRLPTASHLTTTIFNMIVKGYTPWKPTQSTFLFYDESNDYTYNSIRFLDRGAQRRVYGSEKFLEASQINEVLTREEKDKQKSKWEQVLLRHPLQVYRERFCGTLKRQYFIYSEIEVKSIRDLVTLAKVEWNGNAEGLTADELSGEAEVLGALDVKTMLCPAGSAYDTLVELMEGRKDWSS